MIRIRSIVCSVALILILPLIVGCGDPKLDTSSDETFEKSLQKVYESAAPKDQERFGEYLEIAFSGKASLYRKDVKIDELVQMYSLYKAFGNDADKKKLAGIHDKTAKEIISIGKSAKKEKLEKALPEMKAKLAGLEASTQEFTKYTEEQAKVTVGFGENIEAAPSRSQKQILGSLTIPITIHNGSSLRLILFEPGNDTFSFSDEDGSIVNIRADFEFFNEDGKRLFDKVYASEGIAPGTTVKGALIAKIRGREAFLSSDELPYPLTKKILINYKHDGAVLEGHRQLYENREAAIMFEQIKTEIEKVNAELVNLAN